MDKAAEISDLMAAGDRAYITNDLELAAEKFSLATERLVGAYGDFAPECFESYFKYGRALAGLAQLEAEDPQMEFKTVQNYLAKMTEGKDVNMDDSRIGDPDELPEEERKEIIANVDRALEENRQQLDDIAEEEQPPELPETEEKIPEATTYGQEEVKDDDDGELDATAEDGEMEEGEDEEEEDLPSIVLAYENLEVARKIAEKAGNSKEWELKRAEVLSIIGELYLKEDKYAEAIADLETALQINQRHLPANDRVIASSFFELALAHHLNDDYLAASEHAAKAMEILKFCVEQAKAGEDDAKKISELEECLKAVAAAHEDYVSSHKDAQMKKDAEAKEAQKVVSPEKNEENQQPPQDITSNIRKGKRPAEGTNEDAAKKLKVNEADPASEIPADDSV